MNDFGKMTIKSVVADVDQKYIKNRSELGSNLDDTLKNKYVKVGKDEEKYIELLRYNIIFYKSIIKKLEVIIEMWVQNGIISSTQSVEKSITNITNSSKEYVNIAMRKGHSYLNDKDKKIFLSYDNTVGLKRIEKVENDYKILNLYKDILSMMISVISEDAVKYNVILDMSIEKLKIDIMNEIFSMINEILFNDNEVEKDSFKDEALVEEKLFSGNIDDEEKCLGFKKYVAMISTPEISVRINDVFRSVVELENIDEEEANLFDPEFKDYISCVVLLMDYVSPENRIFLNNAFRIYISKHISQSQFEETVDKLVIERTFIDKRTWLECQKMVKSDFNLENNNFFGNENEEIEEHLSISDRLDIIEKLGDEMTVDECIEYMKYSKPGFGISEKESIDSNSGFANKIKRGLFTFSEKLKSRENFEEYEDEFDDYDDYEDYEDDGYYEDEDDLEDYEKGRSGLKSKFKSLFKKNDNDGYDEYDKDDDYDSEYDDLEEDEAYSVEGESSIQDKNAIAILKMRAKNKRKNIAKYNAEIKDLKSERKIAEEINKNGIGSFKNSEIVFTEKDYVYKKTDSNFKSRNEDLFDDIIEGQMTFDDIKGSIKTDKDGIVQISQNTEEQSYNEHEENEHFKPILGKTQNENISKSQNNILDITQGPKRHEDNNKSIENIESIDSDNAKSNNIYELNNKNYFDKNIKSNKKVDSFEELEDLKSRDKDGDNKKDTYVSSDVYKSNQDSLDVTKINLKSNDSDSRKEKALKSMKSFGGNVSKKINKIREARADKVSDETTMFPKSVIIRDLIIIIGIVVLVFASYVYIIKGFNRPTVEETNNNAKQTQSTNKNTSKVKSSSDIGKDKTTTEITQKTEAEKEKDEIETKASALDREAENYKSGKGTYYTVFVGATKSQDAAETYANNFGNRGINSKVVRNGGFYMLKVGEYFNITDAYNESARITAKGIQNYVSTQNKYYDLKIEAFKIRSKNLSAEQIKTDYNDLKNQISSTGKNEQYIKNLDEIYKEALKDKQ